MLTYSSFIRSFGLFCVLVSAVSCLHLGPKPAGDPSDLRAVPDRLYSLRSDVHAGLLIRNQSKRDVVVFWIGYRGERHPQAHVKAGATHPVGGYLGHAFIIEDDTPGPERGKLVRIAYPDFPTGETIIRDQDFIDTVTHSEQTILGWTIRIEKSMTDAEKRIITERVTELLAEVRQLAPPKHLPFLQSIVLWFDEDAGANRGQYHPGYYWMKGSGWHLEKRKAIHFTRIDTLERALKTQPMVVLHELSHAFHDQVLGFDDKRVIKAYENAKTLKLYDKIQHVGGKVGRAYAMTNEREYFAELTEAYFGRNDFYPFTREELLKHDPVGYQMIEKAWGL